MLISKSKKAKWFVYRTVGSGKSTYLRSLNQLEHITSGKIYIEDTLVIHREHNRTIYDIDLGKRKACFWKWVWFFKDLISSLTDSSGKCYNRSNSCS
jgi:ABC-type oligopeptide transport system ATPase subunit